MFWLGSGISCSQTGLTIIWSYREKTGFKFVKLWDAGEAGLVEFQLV